jgi:acetylglutamate kinase
MEQLIIVKIGGNIIDDSSRLKMFLMQLSAIEGYKILVHGGGKIATETGKKLGIEANYVDGRRITDAATLELVTMVYGGLVNKNIVSLLQNAGTNAIGLTGADGCLIRATKRPVGTIDYGYVGDIAADGINTALLSTLLHSRMTPVISPLSYEQGTGLLNTNADTIANEIAIAMSTIMQVKLVYCFEQVGVLRDISDTATVIPVITATNYHHLKTIEVISGGMIPKLDNAFRAIAHGVEHVIIGQAEDVQALLSGTKGTLIK